MRKFVKNSILEIFQTMYEAHASIKKMIDKKDFENVQVLLEDCQNTAVQIGTSIESSEGEGFVTVGYLEEYCEAVYEVATSIADDYSGNKAQKVLDKKLIKAENSVKNDVKVRLEIVFCPYKASMWDSLESVWKAADEDPDCDAYVVPIPYYDRNPDYSFGEFHYEGGDYPDYVPITHYEAYNFEARRPDVVYIHNPYDDCNYVTSVDPRFYSKELKKYTDKLIYIPYFVLAEPNPDDPNAVEGVAHFAITPGVINADKVIVQSEAMKQTYIKALLNQFGDTPENRNILENKISGTGSPKFDKVTATSKNDVKIPDEWLKIIKKPDGTWKKVIFYNTSVAAILKYREGMINKIERVLRVFKSFSDSVVLLWRPHPLLESTLKSMLPELLPEYQRIKRQYLDEKWGIFDISPDIDRAVCLCDKYYGDLSSVVELFSASQKPVLLQFPFFSEGQDIGINVELSSGVIRNGFLYFTIPMHNMIFFKDLKTGKVDYYSSEIEFDFSKTVFDHCVGINDEIFFISDNTNEYYCLDLQKKSLKKGSWFLENMRFLGTDGAKIFFIDPTASNIAIVGSGSVSYNCVEEGKVDLGADILWFYCASQKKIWKINTSDNKKELLTGVSTESLGLSEHDANIIFKDGMLLIDNYNTECLRIYDTATNLIRKVEIPYSARYYYGRASLKKIYSEEGIYYSSAYSSEMFRVEGSSVVESWDITIPRELGCFEEIYNSPEKFGYSTEIYMNLRSFLFLD